MFAQRDFFQIAYFVQDLEASIDRWASMFGAGPFVVAPHHKTCLLYTSPSPRDLSTSRMPSSA